MLRALSFLLVSLAQTLFFWLYANLALFKESFSLNIVFKTQNASHPAILILTIVASIALSAMCLTDLFSPRRFPDVAAKFLAIAIPVGAAATSYLLISEHSRELLNTIALNPSALSHSAAVETLLPPLNALLFVFSAMTVLFTTNLVAIFYQDRGSEHALASNYILFRLIFLSIIATIIGFLLTLTESGGHSFKFYFVILCLIYVIFILAIPISRMNLLTAASNIWVKVLGVTLPSWLSSIIEPLKNAGWFDGLISFIGN